LFSTPTEVKFRTREKISNIYKWKEKIQENTQLSFWWKRKVQVMKFAFEDFIFVVGSVVNLVGTTLELAAFCNRLDAKYMYSRASAFLFFLFTTMVFVVV